MALSAQIALSIIAHETTSGDLSSQMRVTPSTFAMMLADGTGANQAQVAWSDSYAWTDGTSVPYLLYGLPDDRGTLALSALKVLYIKNKGTTPILVNVTSFATAPIQNGGKVEVQGGGAAVFIAPTAGGWAVGGASSMTISRATESSSADFDITFIGEGTIL